MTVTQPLCAIDHPVIAVADMESARVAYERLGFTIPPRGSHLEWGTGNWCIMFDRDYLELRGIVDANKYTHHLPEFLAAHGEGLLGVAFATDNAGASGRQMADRGLHPLPVRELTRRLEIPDAPVEPRFSLCFLPAEETPGLMSVVLCQHLTPELLRQPAWLKHKNGAQGVLSLTAVVDDLEAAAQAHRKLFGDAGRVADQVLSIRFGHGQSIALTTAENLDVLHPGLENRIDNGLVAVTLRTNDLENMAGHFKMAAVRHERLSDDRLRVDPREACNVVLEFASQA